jgi:hypothetical protein
MVLMRYLVLVGLIVGGLLGYYVLWSHLVDQVAMQANAWIEGQRRQGREVAHDGLRLWGFPYRLSLTLTRPRWVDAQNPIGWRLEADEITAHLQLWDLNHIIFDLPGRQRIGWREAAEDRQVSIQTNRFRASLVADGAGNWLRIAADLHEPKLSGPKESLLSDWSADKLLLHARRAGNVPPSIDIAAQADDLVLPGTASLGPLGREIAHVRLVGNARGSLFGRTLEEVIGSWRDSGGIIDFTTVSVGWGSLQLDGDGSLSLDRQFRPLGAMSSKIRGVDGAIDALVSAGRMRGQDAAAAKAVTTMLSKQDDKGLPYLQVPLTAQDGKLFLGPVSLLSLPSVLPGQ